MRSKTNLPKPNLPQHVAIIMDGNGRWAKKRMLPRVAGHRKGVDAVKNSVKFCLETGIPHLTLFAFSTENWRRPPHEVSVLMALFLTMLQKEVAEINDNGICLKIIGDVSILSSDIQLAIKKAESLTKNNTKLTLNVAINYGGRWDIVQACKKAALAVQQQQLNPEDIDETYISNQLSTANQPNPDLFIRTSGESRMSNFLIWQLAYAELYFTETHWPDFNQQIFQQAVDYFAQRTRRFGRTDEQLASSNA